MSIKNALLVWTPGVSKPLTKTRSSIVTTLATQFFNAMLIAMAFAELNQFRSNKCWNLLLKWKWSGTDELSITYQIWVVESDWLVEIQLKVS